MKFKIVASLLFTICTIYLFSGFKIQEPSQVYFMRSTNMEGTLTAYKVFIDDSLVCHLKNKRYSVHEITPGEHTVSIQNAGLGSHAKSRPLKINVKEGKNNYVIAVNGPELYLQETVETSAKELLKKVALSGDCLTEKDKK